MKTETILAHRRDTKGTHLYCNNEPGAPMKSVYIKKGTFDGQPPAVIKITVEAD